MSEQGPTELEIAVVFGGAKPRSMDCQCSGSSVQCRAHQWRAAETVALKLDGLSRARHIREAVEAMPFTAEPEADFVAVEWVSERGNRHRVTMPRAALLDALTKGNE